METQLVGQYFYHGDRSDTGTVNLSGRKPNDSSFYVDIMGGSSEYHGSSVATEVQIPDLHVSNEKDGQIALVENFDYDEHASGDKEKASELSVRLENGTVSIDRSGTTVVAKLYAFDDMAVGRLSHVVKGYSPFVVADSSAKAAVFDDAFSSQAEKVVAREMATHSSSYACDGIAFVSMGLKVSNGAVKENFVSSIPASATLALQEITKQKITLLKSGDNYVLLFRDFTLSKGKLYSALREMVAHFDSGKMPLAKSIVNGTVYPRY